MLDLRALSVNHPSHFEAVAKFVANQGEVPDFVAAKLRQMKFAKAGDPLTLYDDVRDVVECCTEWHGSRPRFSAQDLLAVDQTKIVPPDEGE